MPSAMDGFCVSTETIGLAFVETEVGSTFRLASRLSWLGDEVECSMLITAIFRVDKTFDEEKVAVLS